MRGTCQVALNADPSPPLQNATESATLRQQTKIKSPSRHLIGLRRSRHGFSRHACLYSCPSHTFTQIFVELDLSTNGFMQM